jgi:hypothetical protein
MNYCDIHQIATDVANCALASKSDKMLLRRKIIRMVVSAIEASEEDINLLPSLKNLLIEMD